MVCTNKKYAIEQQRYIYNTHSHTHTRGTRTQTYCSRTSMREEVELRQVYDVHTTLYVRNVHIKESFNFLIPIFPLKMYNILLVFCSNVLDACCKMLGRCVHSAYKTHIGRHRWLVGDERRGESGGC